MQTVAEETRLEGTIGLRMYWKYFKAGANIIMLILLVLLNLLAQVYNTGVLYTKRPLSSSQRFMLMLFSAL